MTGTGDKAALSLPASAAPAKAVSSTDWNTPATIRANGDVTVNTDSINEAIADAEARRLWSWFREISLREFQRIYDRLGVSFDTLAQGEAFYEDRLAPTLARLHAAGLTVEGDKGARKFLKSNVEHADLVEVGDIADGKPIVVPNIVYANVVLPGQELSVHTDVPEFRGANRKHEPEWLLVVMHLSGLFEPWRMPIATGGQQHHAFEPHQRAHLAGDGVSAQRLRRLRHDRQCLGVDHRLVDRQARAGRTEGLLRSRESARWA